MSAFGKSAVGTGAVGINAVGIGAIDLNYDEQAAVEEFTVEFRYQYFESNTTT